MLRNQHRRHQLSLRRLQLSGNPTAKDDGSATQDAADSSPTANLEADVAHDCSPEESLHEVSCFQHGCLHAPRFDILRPDPLLDSQCGRRLEARRAPRRDDRRDQRNDREDGDHHDERHEVARVGAHDIVLQQPTDNQ